MLLVRCYVNFTFLHLILQFAYLTARFSRGGASATPSAGSGGWAAHSWMALRTTPIALQMFKVRAGVAATFVWPDWLTALCANKLRWLSSPAPRVVSVRERICNGDWLPVYVALSHFWHVKSLFVVLPNGPLQPRRRVSADVGWKRLLSARLISCSICNCLHNAFRLLQYHCRLFGTSLVRFCAFKNIL